jgi:simple sugar transport system substrate-binding protein
MINQFKEAVAAKPSCIEIMGHPGSAAFEDLVKGAVDQGIVVTVGNSPMTDLQATFGTAGMGYAGVDLYAGGKLTAEHMIAQGLKSGDQAMVYMCSAAERGQPRRAFRHAEAAGSRSTARDHAGGEQRRLLAVPVLTAYIQAHPSSRHRHPAWRRHRHPPSVEGGKKPGEIIVGGTTRARDHRRREVRLRVGDARPPSSRASCRSCSASDGEVQDARLNLNTGAGTVTLQNIDSLVELIDAGIRCRGIRRKTRRRGDPPAFPRLRRRASRPPRAGSSRAETA